jgi:1-acyl-sn-glycerol-3-phosphate acyltransferase
MIFAISIFLAIASSIFFGYLSYIHTIPLVFSVLLGILGGAVTVFVYALFLVVFVCTTGYFLAKTNNPNGKFRNAMMRDIARFCLFWTNVHYHAYNLDKLPKDRNFVLVGNHQSLIDVLMLFCILKKPYTIVFKDTFLKNKLIGPMAKSLGGMPIYRTDDYKTAEIIVKVIQNVRKGSTLLIFPEGTRSKGPQMNRFRAGSFKIPLKAGVPIVVFANDGSYRAKFRLPLRRTDVYFNVVDVLDYETFKTKTTQEISHQVHEAIEMDIAEARKKYKWLKIPKFFIKHPISKKAVKASSENEDSYI